MFCYWLEELIKQNQLLHVYLKASEERQDVDEYSTFMIWIGFGIGIGTSILILYGSGVALYMIRTRNNLLCCKRGMLACYQIQTSAVHMDDRLNNAFLI